MEFKRECIHCIPDESLIGKRVLCSDTFKGIMVQVESNNWPSCREVLVEIDENADLYPFGTSDTGSSMDVVHYYTFVYYDPEWDEKDKETTYYCYLNKDEFMFDSEKPSSHIYATFTDVRKATKWCCSHDKFAEIAKAWEDGKIIQVYSPSFQGGKWIDCGYHEPCWDVNVKYRVKPDEPVEVETSEGKMYLANGAEIPKKRRMTNRELARWLAQGNGQWRGIANNTIGMSYSYGIFDDKEILDGIMIRGWDETEWHEPEIEVGV